MVKKNKAKTEDRIRAKEHQYDKTAHNAAPSREIVPDAGYREGR